MWPARPLTLGALYVMVMAFPAIFTDSVAGGLLGGPCWAKRAVAVKRRLAQTKRRFMVLVLLLAGIALKGRMTPTGRLSHRAAGLGNWRKKTSYRVRYT